MVRGHSGSQCPKYVVGHPVGAQRQSENGWCGKPTRLLSEVGVQEGKKEFYLYPYPPPFRSWTTLSYLAVELGSASACPPSGPALPPRPPPSLSGLPALSVLGEGEGQMELAVGGMGINAHHPVAWG